MMNPIQLAGIRKKSFEQNFRGGTIWCEHLDGMGGHEDEAIHKFLEDKASIAFVGVPKRWQRRLIGIQENGCVIRFFTDYEKANEWVI